MEFSVDVVLNHINKKFKDVIVQKSHNGKGKYNHRNPSCEFPGSSVSRFFCGSDINPDLDSCSSLLSYRRDDLKPICTVPHKQSLCNINERHDATVKSDISKKECSMKFHGADICQESWALIEEERLCAAVNKYNELYWCEIADSIKIGHSLKTRTPMQCLQHYQLNFNRRLVCSLEWSTQEDIVLTEAVSLYGTNRTWQHIANCLEGRAASQCYDRWKRLCSTAMKNGTWSDSEERRLVGAVVAHEKNRSQVDRHRTFNGEKSSLWRKISLCVPGRDDVRCREKWKNVLDPSSVNIAQFTQEEDAIIIRQTQEYQNTKMPLKWSKIAELLRGRTDSQCFRRWRELSGSSLTKDYVESSRKRRAVIVPRHSRSKVRKSRLDDNDFVPILYTPLT